MTLGVLRENAMAFTSSSVLCVIVNVSLAGVVAEQVRPVLMEVRAEDEVQHVAVGRVRRPWSGR